MLPNASIALLSDSAAAVQDALNNIDPFAKVLGLRINASKTKVMSTQPRPGTQHAINLGGVPLEEVQSFKYMGSSFTATGQAKDEISGRIGLPRSASARLFFAPWTRREISLKTKGCIYEALIRTVLLYGCEMWPVLVEDHRRLEVFKNDCLGCLLPCCHRDRVPQRIPASTLQSSCSPFGPPPTSPTLVWARFQTGPM